jgi:molecular chaperone DnaJ
MSDDYYDILGVKKGSDAAELKKAYRKQAMKYHPDTNKDSGAEARFKEINEAYDVLKDDQKRAAYDAYGKQAFQNGGGGGRGGFSGFGGGAGAAGFSDIFEEMFGDMMGGRGRGGGQHRGGAARGSDLQYNLDISLEDAFNGTDKTIRIPTWESCGTCSGDGAKPGTKPQTCGSCNGAGRVRAQQGFFTVERVCPTCSGGGQVIKEKCGSCSGEGRMRTSKTLKVNVPSGIEDGRRIRLNNEGEAGLKGGPAGDLYVLINVKSHKFYQREGANLYCRVPVAMTDAALGGEVNVPTIEGGKAEVKIPAGTQTGQQFRLKGKGMSVLHSSQRGDAYIEIFVETPVNLSGKQKDMLKGFGGKDPSKNSPESSGFLNKVKEFWEDLTD